MNEWLLQWVQTSSKEVSYTLYNYKLNVPIINVTYDAMLAKANAFHKSSIVYVYNIQKLQMARI